MKKICLRSAGISRNKYIGVVEPFGILPFRLNVGPDEIFEIRRPDGSEWNDQLHHGDAVSFRKPGGFLDTNNLNLSREPHSFVVEKLDDGGKVRDGDRICLRTENGWLASDCHGLKVKSRADWAEVALQIYEIPEFSREQALSLLHQGKPIDSLRLGPNGQPAGGDARIHVKLDRAAPPGGILVSFNFDSPDHRHVCIPCILLDGVREGFAPIHFAHVDKIPESGIRLHISAEIPCSGEHSVKFYGNAEGLERKGSVALSVRKLPDFEPVETTERRSTERRVQDRRTQDRRGIEGRQRKHGFDNHFLERRRPAALYS